MRGVFVLPESLSPENKRNFSWARSNPIGALDAPSAAVAWPLGALSFVLLGCAGVATWFGARGPSLVERRTEADTESEQS